MKTRFALAVAVIGLAAYAAAAVLATPVMGVQGTNLGVGAFDSLEAKTLTPNWQARASTRRAPPTSTSSKTRSHPAGRSVGTPIPGLASSSRPAS